MFKSRGEFAIAMAKGGIFTFESNKSQYIFYMETKNTGSSPFVVENIKTGHITIMSAAWCNYDKVVPYYPWVKHLLGTWPDCKPSDVIEVKYRISDKNSIDKANNFSWLLGSESGRNIIEWRHVYD